MTPEERKAELEILLNTSGNELQALGYETFADFHKRAEELMERPVWTHEFADPEYLYHELLSGIQPTMEGIVAKLPHDKPVIVIGPDE